MGKLLSMLEITFTVCFFATEARSHGEITEPFLRSSVDNGLAVSAASCRVNMLE